MEQNSWFDAKIKFINEKEGEYILQWRPIREMEGQCFIKIEIKEIDRAAFIKHFFANNDLKIKIKTYFQSSSKFKWKFNSFTKTQKHSFLWANRQIWKWNKNW